MEFLQRWVKKNPGKYLGNAKKYIPVTHLAWADFKIKVKPISHSTVHFDQWNPLMSKIQLLKIFPLLFRYSDQHAFWNFIENKNDENFIMKSHKK